MLKIFLTFLVILSFSFADERLYTISPKDAFNLLKDKNTVFIDAEDSESYKKEHIPNSINLDALALQDIALKNNEKQKCKYLPLCPQTAAKIFSEKGITHKNKFIIYYNELPNKASYIWFLLYSMGVDDKNLRILDGGINGWKKEGLPTESGDEKLRPKASFKPNPRYDVVATKEEVLKHVENYQKGIDDNTLLIDTRTFLEFTGRQEMTDIKRAGHIPGAKFVYWRWFAGKDTTYKPFEKLQEDVKKLNIDFNKRIILYCTIGNRSSFVFIPLKALGAKNLKIYTGSWYEWGNDENLPIEKEKYRKE
ncbi:rhodanese-like domain-containing protein [Sulfurihydrogenibium sp.]|uniref:sulfurtransferase n=1 Tax=Sulfurihydrogenibium sp. TaxID=2053621 RepID=UPI00260FF8E0|nr:rhodanese-like domain-containing protein [Sulfurihydrogenibium sp.]